mmetsp:Transcript_68784/g.197232  ORF Transcript_68784/g.197232 Transcript_68784/m.197232 type:complete len:211 (-) Transcript_68784:220-852(-)
MAPRRTGSLLSALMATGLVALTFEASLAFVGSGSAARRGALVARPVGVDYLLRRGPKNADPPLVDISSAKGATVEITFKKRPFGINRYAPGKDGNGAMVMDIKDKSRYPGDPQGQAVVAGVKAGWIVKSVNGEDMTKVKLETIMEYLDDEVLDPVEALSLNLKESGTPTDFKLDANRKVDNTYSKVGESTFKFGGGKKADVPMTIVYQEM